MLAALSLVEWVVWILVGFIDQIPA